jgi:hypothetical protein
MGEGSGVYRGLGGNLRAYFTILPGSCVGVITGGLFSVANIYGEY